MDTNLRLERTASMEAFAKRNADGFLAILRDSSRLMAIRVADACLLVSVLSNAEDEYVAYPIARPDLATYLVANKVPTVLVDVVRGGASHVVVLFEAGLATVHEFAVGVDKTLN